MFLTWCSVLWEMLPSQRARRLGAAFPEYREMVTWSRLHLHVSSRLQRASRTEVQYVKKAEVHVGTMVHVVLRVEPPLRQGCLQTQLRSLPPAFAPHIPKLTLRDTWRLGLRNRKTSVSSCKTSCPAAQSLRTVIDTEICYASVQIPAFAQDHSSTL